MTDPNGVVTDAERAAVLAQAAPARSTLPPGRALLRIAVTFAAVAVILSQIAQIQTSHARGEQVSDLREVVERLRSRVDLLDAELGCRSVISGDLDVAQGRALETILRGLGAIAVADRPTVAALGDEAGVLADSIDAAVAARIAAVATCSEGSTP